MTSPRSASLSLWVTPPVRADGYAFKDGYPTEGARQANEDMDFQRAVTAYRFFYPTVSVKGVMQGTRDAGVEDNKASMDLAGAPRHALFTGNSDTPYMGATMTARRTH